MATSKFAREPKMFTTEPSVDEVGKGMKRGGRAIKKHMFDGGVMGAAAPMATPAVPRRRPPMVPSTAMPRNPMMRAPMARAPMMRKNGGEVESPAEHKAEMREMRKLGKELKHHEEMRASKAHRGLKAGGSPAPKAGPDEIGGLAGGLEATRPNPKKDTGGVRAPGYMHGGKVHRVSGHPEGTHKHHMAMAKHHAAKHAEGGSAHHAKMHEHHKYMAKMCKGGQYAEGGEAMDKFETKTTLKPKLNINDKVHNALSHKGGKSTGSLEGKGYKHGGKLKKFASGGMAIAEKYQTHINDASKPHKSTGKTGDLEGSRFKHGGHVMHHKSHQNHAEGGHVHMHQHAAKHAHGHDHQPAHPMKHGGGAKHHTTKVSTHHKKGGVCNY